MPIQADNEPLNELFPIRAEIASNILNGGRG